jgi:amidase
MFDLPSLAELQDISNEIGFHLDKKDLEIFRLFLEREMAPAFDALEAEVEKSSQDPDVHRDPGHFPSTSENPLGAWAWKCSVKGKDFHGILAGKRIALKDNVALAGVPMTNGTVIMKDYVPSFDAEVAKRIIRAGGEIVGKSTCENFCWTGGSCTSFPQRVLNPHNPNFMAGGSSSGSGALVAAREVDMAIGADQGGSIRIPSSWCGIFGLKPTYGLVPYTGEMTFDHVGPMAQTVEDVARLLQAIAGRNGLDPRQAQTPSELPRYFENLRADVRGLKIGIVAEGFGWKESESDVEQIVRDSARRFGEIGAEVNDVSIPIHRKTAMLMLGIDIEGSWRTLKNHGINFGSFGFEDAALASYLGERLFSGNGDFSPNARLTAILGQYLIRKYYGKYYAKSQNIRPTVRKEYDDVLGVYDLLLMPTTPQKAQPFPKPDDIMGSLYAGSNMVANVAPFDYTGHPAMNVPCGFSNGLPVGMMLVGRHFDEQRVLNAALAFQQIK